MTFGTLVVTAFARNRLRSFFTFATVVAAFCLFGALETLRYQRERPLVDDDLVVVQADGSSGMPLDYEAKALAMKGVQAASGLMGIPVQNPKSASAPLIVFASNPYQVPRTLPGMRIQPAVAASWAKLRIGALCDERTAREQGWRVNDTLSLQLMTGQTTRTGETRLQVILLGTYSTDSILTGLLVSTDYLTNAFPRTNRLFNIFVRPERPGEGRQLAQHIDEQFRGGVEPTFSAVVSDFRESSAKDASTMRLVLRGSLAISFFTMVLMVANALMQSVRERLGELAVMQALGFSLRAVLVLVLAEALTLFAAGAAVGLTLANVAFAYEIAGIRSVFDSLPSHTLAMAGFYVVLCALIAAAIPCWELSKLKVSDALRRL